LTVMIFCGILGELGEFLCLADVAELAYAHGSGPCGATLESSTLSVRTMYHSRLPAGGTGYMAQPFLILMQLYLRYKIIIICAGVLFAAGCAGQGPYLKLDPTLQADIRVFESVQYVPLMRICEAYSLDCKWDSVTRVAVIAKNGNIILRAGSDRILVNGNERKLTTPVVFTNSTVYVPTGFVRNDLALIVRALPVEKVPEKIPAARAPGKYAIKKIIIDPGHGGKDPGAIGRRSKIRERDLTLAISKKLKRILEDHGITVLMTRDRDVFVSLPRRVRAANLSGADLFISIHINASRSRMMNGFECYYLSEATDDNARAVEAFENASLDPDEGTVLEHYKGLDKTLWDIKLTENRRESAELASDICKAVDASLAARSRGIKTAKFYVLKWTRIPAVLVEAGYISNKFEELKFRDERYIDRITDVIAKGVLAFKDKYERTEGFTL
jgi:N-acetylmuramoyl-L-alanine amidase